VLPAAAEESEAREPLIQAGEASFDLGVEYRLRNIYINPLELNGLDAVEVGYGVQRLRTAWEFNWDDKSSGCAPPGSSTGTTRSRSRPSSTSSTAC
jgi:hypothetical protein